MGKCLRLSPPCEGIIWLRKTRYASSPIYPQMWRDQRGQDQGPPDCLHSLSETMTEAMRFTYPRIPHLERWREWVSTRSRCLTGEGDWLGQLSFRRCPSSLGWIHFRLALGDVGEDASGLFLLRWSYRRFLPGHLLFRPLTVKRAEIHLVADHLLPHRLRCLLRAHPSRYQVLIAKINSSGRTPRQHWTLLSLACV